jgi:hypothetical protein
MHAPKPPEPPCRSSTAPGLYPASPSRNARPLRPKARGRSSEPSATVAEQLPRSRARGHGLDGTIEGTMGYSASTCAKSRASVRGIRSSSARASSAFTSSASIPVPPCPPRCMRQRAHMPCKTRARTMQQPHARQRAHARSPHASQAGSHEGAVPSKTSSSSADSDGSAGGGLPREAHGWLPTALASLRRGLTGFKCALTCDAALCGTPRRIGGGWKQGEGASAIRGSSGGATQP